jgi:hypothetical protein
VRGPHERVERSYGERPGIRGDRATRVPNVLLGHYSRNAAQPAIEPALTRSHTVQMDNPHHSDSIVIARSPEEVYDMVSDVTRMGEWSPVCKACWWDDGDSARVGAWFTGRNELPERTWETRSEVVAADRGQEFAFIVGGSYTRWGYTFTAVDGGTRVTESWEFLAGGAAMFEERFGADAQAQAANRAELARTGIPVTLAALKRIAEAH